MKTINLSDKQARELQNILWAYANRLEQAIEIEYDEKDIPALKRWLKKAKRITKLVDKQLSKPKQEKE